MKTKTKGSAAPEKQQIERKDPFDCYDVDRRPKNVVERSYWKLKCEDDV